MSLHDRILDEATRLFAARGYQATSVREVCEAAGCTKPALYYHFGSKEALFRAAIRAETDHHLALSAHHLGANDSRPARERLVCTLRRFFERLRTRPTGLRLLMRAELRPDEEQPDIDFASLRAHHQERMEEFLALGVERGEIRADVPLEDAAHALSGMVDRRLQLWLQGKPIAEDVPERLVALFFRGVST